MCGCECRSARITTFLCSNLSCTFLTLSLALPAEPWMAASIAVIQACISFAVSANKRGFVKDCDVCIQHDTRDMKLLKSCTVLYSGVRLHNRQGIHYHARKTSNHPLCDMTIRQCHCTPNLHSMIGPCDYHTVNGLLFSLQDHGYSHVCQRQSRLQISQVHHTWGVVERMSVPC